MPATLPHLVRETSAEFLVRLIKPITSGSTAALIVIAVAGSGQRNVTLQRNAKLATRNAPREKVSRRSFFLLSLCTPVAQREAIARERVHDTIIRPDVSSIFFIDATHRTARDRVDRRLAPGTSASSCTLYMRCYVSCYKTEPTFGNPRDGRVLYMITRLEFPHLSHLACANVGEIG